MSRGKRSKSKIKLYHIMSRAVLNGVLFDEECDYLMYLNILNEAKNEFDIKVYAYCLMKNHFHLVLFDLNDNFSRFMNKLNYKYAMYYNRKNQRTGILFNDKFKSEAINDYDYLASCIRYIHQNPVNSLICDSVYEYKFSSIHAYKNDQVKDIHLSVVDVEGIYEIFDRKNFLKFNETDTRDRCMDVRSDKFTDTEVTKILYDLLEIKNKKEYLEIEEPVIMSKVVRLMDKGISINQLSRVTGYSYNKIKKVRDREEAMDVRYTYKIQK